MNCREQSRNLSLIELYFTGSNISPSYSQAADANHRNISIINSTIAYENLVLVAICFFVPLCFD